MFASIYYYCVRYTGNSVRCGGGTQPVTEQCQVWPDTVQGDSPVWVDTVGWEDRHSDNTDTFQVRILQSHFFSLCDMQETLRYLSNKSLTSLAAIIWCIQPSIRQVNINNGLTILSVSFTSLLSRSI